VKVAVQHLKCGIADCFMNTLNVHILPIFMPNHYQIVM